MQRLRTPKWIKWALAIWKLVTLITISSNFELSCILCIKILMRANDYINTTHSSYLPSRLGSQISLHILELVPVNSCKARFRSWFGDSLCSAQSYGGVHSKHWQIWQNGHLFLADKQKEKKIFWFFFLSGEEKINQVHWLHSTNHIVPMIWIETGKSVSQLSIHPPTISLVYFYY